MQIRHGTCSPLWRPWRAFLVASLAAVCRQGEGATSLFVVISGRVRLVREDPSARPLVRVEEEVGDPSTGKGSCRGSRSSAAVMESSGAARMTAWSTLPGVAACCQLSLCDEVAWCCWLNQGQLILSAYELGLLAIERCGCRLGVVIRWELCGP